MKSPCCAAAGGTVYAEHSLEKRELQLLYVLSSSSPTSVSISATDRLFYGALNLHALTAGCGIEALPDNDAACMLAVPRCTFTWHHLMLAPSASTQGAID